MSKSSFPPGLYVAATPIGHLADITERVRDGLAGCDLIFAEDTRRAQSLLSALGIQRARSSIRALHEHNEKDARNQVVNALSENLSVMLISDAGTPAVSDPGFQAVDAAWRAGFRVSPLPGPSVVIAALSVCGFARWPMSFWGFAPAKTSARLEWLHTIQEAGGLAVMFEAPHRAEESIQDCAEIFGESTPMLFARELTKQHETLLRGSIGEVKKQIQELKDQDPGSAKGEMAWVFDLGDKPVIDANQESLKAWAAMLRKELPAASGAKILVKMLGVSRDDAYQAMLNKS